MRKILYILSVVIIIFNVILLSKNQKIKEKNNVMEEQYDALRLKESSYKKTIYFALKNEGKRLKNLSCRTIEGKESTLLNSLSSSQKMVFYYNNYDCSSCIDSVYSYLKQYSSHADLVVISDFRSYARMKSIKASKFDNSSNVIFFRIADELDLETPCLFYLDTNLIVRKYFHVTQEYNILREYFLTLYEQRTNDSSKVQKISYGSFTRFSNK